MAILLSKATFDSGIHGEKRTQEYPHLQYSVRLGILVFNAVLRPFSLGPLL